MDGWHHWFNGHGFGWTLGVGNGQGGLVCCGSWGCKESERTEQLNWLIDWLIDFHYLFVFVLSVSPSLFSSFSAFLWIHCCYVCVLSLSLVQLYATPRTVAFQPPLSMVFSRQEYWSGWPFPSPGDLPHPGIQPVSPALQVDSLSLCLLGSDFKIRYPWGLRQWRIHLQYGKCGFNPWVGKIPWEGMATHSNVLAWKIPWTE